MPEQATSDGLRQGIEEACSIMGVRMLNTEQFQVQAVIWLARHGKVDIQGHPCGSFSVRSAYFASTDHTLLEALTGAVLSLDASMRIMNQA